MSKDTANKKSRLSGRIWEVNQSYYHPDHLERNADGTLTGNLLPEFADDKPLITNEKLIEVCEKYTSIKRAALFTHTKDVWTIEDEEENPKHKAGWDKPPHPHLYIAFDKSQDVETLSKWFGVPKQYICKKGGKRGKTKVFEDCLQYGFHESPSAIAEGKTLYDESAILYTKNCNPREEVDAYHNQIDTYKKRCLSRKEELRMSVMREGMTIREALEVDPLIAAEDLNKLQQLRSVYLTKYATLPDHRINFYICPRDSEHGSGIGKSLFSRMLARTLMPNLEDDREIYYEAGSGKSAFQDYDGQPVVIFNDARAGSLLQTFGGRDELFAALDTTPSRKPVDKKYGATTLVQQYTIINGIDSYHKFLSELAGTFKNAFGTEFKAEDERQASRRFPFIVRLDEEDFDLLCNMGFFYGTKEYQSYEELNNFRANMKRLIEVYGEHSIESKSVQKQICEPVVNKTEELHKKLTPKALPDASEFTNYGKQMTEEEAVALKFESCNRECATCRFREEERSGGMIVSVNKNQYCRNQLEKQVTKSSND